MVYETERYLCVDYLFIHIIKVLDKNKKKYKKLVNMHRVSQKKWDLCLNAHNTPRKWTTNKIRVSFGKFRKFPFK